MGIEVQAKSSPIPTPAISHAPINLLQRRCACGGDHGISGECEDCKKKRLGVVQRFPSGTKPSSVPAIVHETLESPGQRLDSVTRGLLEPRFGHDFSHVRVHTDARANVSAQAVRALAYTVGNNIVFGAGQYTPQTQAGLRLVAHELTHVVQQGATSHLNSFEGLTLDRSDSVLEREAHTMGKQVLAGSNFSTGTLLNNAHNRHSSPIVSRADVDAVGHTIGMGRVAQSGIQFWPTNVTDTQVGPVTAQGGLHSEGASRLNVIIGENLSLRRLARQLLPLWITATPFTPPGAAAPLPLDIITEEELAQGLLVYNQTYLPVPAMTNWRSGFRFPLPVEIDVLTGVATLHPLQIRALAGAFDPAWAPLLDQNAAATTTPPAATLAADVTDFLARETTVLARGSQLRARAMTNAMAELPFIQEVFRQLGPDSFEVALEFMANAVNHQISLLAAQRDGAGILTEIRTALAGAPAVVTAAQQESLDRANLMLGLVAGTVAQAPPGAARTLAEKTITVDTLKLDGSTHNPSTDVAMANSILSQCNVRVAHGVNATATNAETTALLGGDTDLRAGTNCSTVTGEERNLFQNGSAQFGFTARYRAFFPGTFTGFNASGYSCAPSDSPTALLRNTAVVQNDGDTDSLAHELGHILINLGPHTATGLMSVRPALPARRLDEISNAHCTRMYNNA
jgi:hypothetical protein